jgi:tetraacyldisaccharide 4'-kinase
LPAGPLRETQEAIQRADGIVLIESFGAANGSIDFSNWAIMRGKPVLRARLQPSSLTYSDHGNWHETPLIVDGRRVVAVSGIANSTGFHAMIDSLGAKLVSALDYPDHYDYAVGDWRNILAAAQEADMVLTTEKDLVKLERLATPQIPLYALRLEVTMEAQDESHLLKLVMERISARRRSGQLRASGVQEEPVSGTESRFA